MERAARCRGAVTSSCPHRSPRRAVPTTLSAAVAAALAAVMLAACSSDAEPGCGTDVIEFGPCSAEGPAGAPTVSYVRCQQCITSGKPGSCAILARDDEGITGLGFWVGNEPDNLAAKPLISFDKPPLESNLRIPLIMPAQRGSYRVQFSAIDAGRRQSTVWCSQVEVR